jgi:hypothetical protein
VTVLMEKGESGPDSASFFVRKIQAESRILDAANDFFSEKIVRTSGRDKREW